jgi:3-oxoacyl-[acyl-carrier-protein] synthase-1
MNRVQPAILRTGLVTSVGLSAASSCAAMRARLSNPSETRFIDSGGAWIMAHQVELDQPWRGLAKLSRMACMAIREALRDIPQTAWAGIPLLLCVAERERAGRLSGLEEELLGQIETLLGVRFAPQSAVLPMGRLAAAAALFRARELLQSGAYPQVLVVGTDTLLTAGTLGGLDQQERLLNERNSNGFMPGEAAGAVLLGSGAHGSYLHCDGVGFSTEAAHVASEEPLRAEGLTRSIRAALEDAGCGLHELDFRLTDLSGEQYYFKEAALALTRTLLQRKEEFDIWHPAESIGETGAASGLAVLALADAACRKGYAPGPGILTHFGTDDGQRAAVVLRFREA